MNLLFIQMSWIAYNNYAYAVWILLETKLQRIQMAYAWCCMQFTALGLDRGDVVQDICPFHLKRSFLSQGMEYRSVYAIVSWLATSASSFFLSFCSFALKTGHLSQSQPKIVRFSWLQVWSGSANFDIKSLKRHARLKVRTFTVLTAKTWSLKSF